MPWIHATLSGPVNDLDGLAATLSAVAAGAVELDAADVVALVSVAATASSPGALVVIAGRDRGRAAEAALADAVRQAVADALGVASPLVAVGRSPS